jgi:hypothetical protein
VYIYIYFYDEEPLKGRATSCTQSYQVNLEPM